MLNHEKTKEYNDHKYPKNDSVHVECEYGCGCWLGPRKVLNIGITFERLAGSGPVGLDIYGECPKSPKDGKSLGGQRDYDLIVTRRINKLIADLAHAEERLKAASPGKEEFVDLIEGLKKALRKKNDVITQMWQLLNDHAKEMQ